MIIDKFRSLLRSSTGKYISVGILVTGILAMMATLYFSFGVSGFEDANTRMYFDENGNLFKQKLVIGAKTRGYPAEPCYWNADGTTRQSPTWVLMNIFAHKSGPTFCPDCGRLVLVGNRIPISGEAPPPLQSEYEKDPKKYPLH